MKKIGIYFLLLFLVFSLFSCSGLKKNFCEGDCQNGYGIWYGSEGKKEYEGHWKNGSLHGYGKKFYPNGDSYWEGLWENGVNPEILAERRAKSEAEKKVVEEKAEAERKSLELHEETGNVIKQKTYREQIKQIVTCDCLIKKMINAGLDTLIPDCFDISDFSSSEDIIECIIDIVPMKKLYKILKLGGEFGYNIYKDTEPCDCE
jgi:hypothetical protein